MLLETTVKTDGTPFSFSLGRLTLVVGPNGGGKTAIRQSLELALDGAVSGHLGRGTVKLAALLGELFPPGAERRVTLLDDSSAPLAIWQQVRDGEKFKAPARTGATFRFPVREVEEALAGDLTKADSAARRAFAVWACGEMTESTVIGAVESRMPRAESAKFADVWKAKASRAAPIEHLLAVLDYVRDRKRELSGEVRGAQAVADAARLAAAEAAADVPAVPVLDYPYDAALVLLDRGLADPESVFCPVCGSGADQEVGHRHLESVIVWAESALLTRGIDPGVPGNRPRVSMPAPSAAAVDPAAIRKANDVVAELVGEQGVVDSLASKLHAAVEDLLERGMAAFEVRVNRFLPAGWRLGVDLKDGFRLGLRREVASRTNVIHAGLSGVELEVVKCAIAAVICTDDEKAILIPGDRAWDARTLRSFLDAMGASPFKGRVLVETTVFPLEGAPAGWDILDLYGEDAEAGVTGVAAVTPGEAAAVWGDTPSETPTSASSEHDEMGDDAARPACLADSSADKPWTLASLREHARTHGRRALKNLYRGIVGKPAAAVWGDEETALALATHLGLEKTAVEAAPPVPPEKPVPVAVEVSAPTPPAPPSPPARAAKPLPPKPVPARPAKPSAPPPAVNLAQRRVLEALGYPSDAIDRMQHAEVRRALVEGLTSDEHEVSAEGLLVAKPGAHA